MLPTVIVFLLFNVGCLLCEVQQMGPDPWNYENDVSSKIENDANIPPDLRLPPRRKEVTDNNIGMNDRFFKRMLTIVLKFGQVQQNEDDSVDVSVQMRFDPKRWQTLNKYTASNTALTDEMYRRTLGYIEDAIYRPTVIDKLVMAWSDYVQFYFIEYKIQITWIFAVFGAVGALIWLWNHMSHKHMILIIFIALYSYECFISYKEGEQQEVQRFLSALNTCKWRFWSSECEVPPPDPLIFLKHMNPLKIAIRMFTTLISEPMIMISEMTKTMIHGISDGLWFPFDKIVYGILVVSFNVLLIFLLIMTVFNYILNIPFQLSLFAGLVSVGVKQRNRTLISENNNNQAQIPSVEGDRISGATLDKLLDVCARALTATRDQVTPQLTENTSNFKIKRSASTGRLHNIAGLSFSNKERPALKGVRKRNAVFSIGKVDGSGDHRL